MPTQLNNVHQRGTNDLPRHTLRPARPLATAMALISGLLCMGPSAHAQSLTEGMRLYQQQQYRAAAVAFKHLEESGEKGEAVFLWQARAYVKNGELPTAEAAIRRGLEVHRDSEELTYWLGHVLAIQGKADLAKLEFRKIADRHPGARSELAALEGGQSLTANAPAPEQLASPVGPQAPLTAAADESTWPPSARQPMRAARAAMAVDTYAGYRAALQHYEQAAGAQADSALILAELAYARLWVALVDREERRCNVFQAMGLPGRSRGQITAELEQAKQEALRACELEPENAAGHATLAIILQQMGERDAAKQALEAARKRTADSRHTLMAEAILNPKKEERLAAVKTLSKGEPANVQFLNWRGLSEFQNKDRDAARTTWQEALRLSPGAGRSALNSALAQEDWNLLRRISRLAEVERTSPEVSCRARFERWLLWEGLLRNILIGLIIGAWLLSWSFNRDAQRAPAFSADQRQKASIARGCTRLSIVLMILFVVYVLAGSVLTFPASRLPPGSITAGPIPSVPLGRLFWPCATGLLFCRHFSRLCDEHRWATLLWQYLLVPLGVGTLVLNPLLEKTLVAITDWW